jgi:EAL domain-containing protein (putative c-di-GMP-specific phosphodiesterase class I)/CheY-like chemotaxis protein
VAATIMVVDDDDYVRRSVERILTRAHYDVLTAVDVREAVRYASRIPMDAAIVDFGLPDSDGIQVLSRLRDLQPACLRILMTGYQDYKIVVEAVNRGEVLRVVRKPFEAASLIQTLQDAFNAAQKMQKFVGAQQAAVEFQERIMLGECLDNNLVRLALQPIVDAHNPDRVVAYEALLRSMHPQLDGPLAVLRVAGRNNRIPDVGARVFDLAAQWLPKIPSHIKLFVNLAPEQLADPARLAEDVRPIMSFAHRVTIEITEQSHLTAISRWEESVQLLRDYGFLMAVDDLGAGHNSLAILAELQPRYIKLDMSLVRDVHLKPIKQRIVEMVVNLANSTDAVVIAEGVETEDEASALVESGAHLLQGYHFGRPRLELD